MPFVNEDRLAAGATFRDCACQPSLDSVAAGRRERGQEVIEV
jgi:hypothetical protein